MVALYSLLGVAPQAGEQVWHFGLLVVALVTSGALVGLIAGLFGVGGGTVIVPVLYETFVWLSVPEDVRMPLCIGTSLAVIVPTSVSAFMAHLERGAVDTKTLKDWVAPIASGVLLGLAIAYYSPSYVFKTAFVLIALVTATRLLFDRVFARFNAPPAGSWQMGLYGLCIGVTSALVGIGGGLLSNIVMTLHGTPLKRAIATSSGVGIIVAVPGSIGYVASGWYAQGLPPLSLGFVSVLGLVLLLPTSLVTARAGAAIAHVLPKRTLECLFAGYLCIISLRFIYSLTF